MTHMETSKNDCQAPRRPMGKNSSPTGTRRYQPSRKGFGSTEDRLRDGKTTSTFFLQPTKVHRDNNDLSNDTTWFTTAQDGLKWDSVDSASVTSGLKKTMRPTTPIVTTTTAKQTAVATKSSRARDNDTTDPLPTRIVDPQTDKQNNKQQSSKATHSAPPTLFNGSESHLHFQRRYRSTSCQVAGGLHRQTQTTSFCMMRTCRQTLALRASQGCVY